MRNVHRDRNKFSNTAQSQPAAVSSPDLGSSTLSSKQTFEIYSDTYASITAFFYIPSENHCYSGPVGYHNYNCATPKLL